jgi:hypothetical protein
MRTLVLLLALFLTVKAAFAEDAAPAPVAMPAGASRIHFDESTQRLYVAADDAIFIYDKDIQSVATVAVAKAADVVLALPLRRGYALDAAQDAVVVFDPARAKIITRMPLSLEAPTVMALEPRTTQLAVFGKEKTVLLDVAGDSDPVTLDFGGVSGAVSDGSGALFAVNGDNEVAVIDAKKGRIAHWALPPSCGGAQALALDDRGRHLFVACKKPLLVSLDSEYGRAETVLDLAVPATALAYEAPAATEAAGKLFALGGGIVSAVGAKPDGGNSLQVFGVTPVPAEASALALDQQGHRLFTLIPDPAAPGMPALEILSDNAEGK